MGVKVARDHKKGHNARMGQHVAEGRYSTQQVARMAGVTYRQLDFWLKREYLYNTTPAYGSGSWREFSAADVEAVRLMGVLVAEGIAPERAGRAVWAAEDEWAEGRWLVVFADGAVRTGDPIAEITARGRGFVVDLEQIGWTQGCSATETAVA